MSDPTCNQPGHDHVHDGCIDSMKNDDRAALLSRAIDKLVEAGASKERLRLLPKDSHENKQLAHFRLGEGALDNDRVRFFEFEPEEAVEAVRNGHPGFAVYYGMERYGTESVFAIDVDHRPTFPFDDVADSAKFTSGSGTGNHLLYENEGDVPNAVADDPVDGEVRADRLYTVLPGSTHPSGGVYDIEEAEDVASMCRDDLPESLTPSGNWSSGGSETKPLEAPEDTKDAAFTNEEGVALETIREWDDYLDQLCSRMDPPGRGHSDTSRFDFHFVQRLLYWRFSEASIRRIWRRYRHREKVSRRGDYVQRTLQNARGTVDEQYDPDHGGGQPDPLAILPLERLDALDHEERVRYAEKRGIDWPGVDDVRDRLKGQIHASVEAGDRAVKSAPTGAGKTHAVATTPWLVADSNPDQQPTIHAHRTKEARDQARQMSEEAGVDAYTLKGRKELCSVARGDHDPGAKQDEDGEVVEDEGLTIEGTPISEWMDTFCDDVGIPFSVVHGWAESELDEPLPCEKGDTQCPAKGQFDGVPRNDDGGCDYDVIHCTHQFLLVPSLRMHTNVFIDEKPAFGIDLDAERVRKSINAYLEWTDAPVDNYSELVFAAEHHCEPDVAGDEMVGGVLMGEYKDGFVEEMEAALSDDPKTAECPKCDGEGELDIPDHECQQITDWESHGGATTPNTCPRCDGKGIIYTESGTPPLTWYRENPDSHALAPAFARAVWKAEESAGGRKHARIPYSPPRFDDSAHDSAAWNRVYVDVVLDDQWEIIDVQSVPDWTLANCVIGLDAHPQKEDPFWWANVKPEIETHFTLSPEERTLYRRYERGLFTVQVGEGTQPVTSGKWLDKGQGKKFEAIVDQLADQYGGDFDSAITSIEAKPFIEEAMEDSGVSEPELMHFGNEESRNDFAGKGVGLVVGSIDPGDGMVLDLLARLGHDAEPCYHECPACEGDEFVQNDDGEEEVCGTCNGSGEVREHGRTFEGPDADKAEAALKGVREHHVAQSAGRWARDAEDPEDNATVFVVTEAAPEGFIDAKAPGVTWTTSSDQRDRLEYVRDRGQGATAKEVSEECDCSKRSALRTLNKAAENGILEKTPGAGPYGADVYSPDEGFAPTGSVDLEPVDAETAPTDVLESYTYTVAVDALPHCAFNTSREDEADWRHQTTFEWYADAPIPPS